MREGYTVHMVIADVCDHERMLIEGTEREEYNSIESYLKQIGATKETCKVMSLPMFTLELNDEEIDVRDSWVAFIYIKDEQ